MIKTLGLLSDPIGHHEGTSYLLTLDVLDYLCPGDS